LAAERRQRHVLPVRQEEETGGPSYHSRLAISNYPLIEKKFSYLVGVFAENFKQNIQADRHGQINAQIQNFNTQ
jgi:hypothetical protein